MNHEKFIYKTIELAKKGIGSVSPNPRVGAVIVKNDHIIAKAFHEKFGGPHAEILALRQLSNDMARQATLYVNLEPCSHFGKTPPCVKAIIASGIKTVVYGMVDPNPLVTGNGLKILREAGIKVIGPIMENECIHLNEGFVKCMLQGIPWMTMKIAQTLDGKISLENGQSRWITGELSRKLVHQYRSEHDAILVGIETIIKDDPQLNVRFIRGPQPQKIVLDSNLRISLDANVITENPEKLIIITSNQSDPLKKRKLTNIGVRVLVTDQSDGLLNLSSIWKNMITAGICSIFIEGGQKVFSSFLNAGYIDQLYVFIAPKIFGQGYSAIEGRPLMHPDQALQFELFSWKTVGTDMLFKGTKTCLQDLLKKSE